MKVVSLETHVVAVPPPHIGGMYWIFVKLKTDCGIEGVGEIYSATFHPSAMTHIIDDVFTRYLLDHDPHHIERLWREAYSSGFTQRPDLTMMGVVSGLEMACWDIIGKAAGKPVYELLGGIVQSAAALVYRTCTRRTADGEYDYDDPDLAAECAAQNVKRGFTAVKFDPAGPYTAYSGHQLSMEVLDRCENSAAGYVKRWAARPICCSARMGRWCPRRRSGWRSGSKNTIRCGSRSRCRRVRKTRWRRSRAHTSIPIAAGERLTTKYEFFKLLRSAVLRRFCN